MGGLKEATGLVGRSRGSNGVAAAAPSLPHILVLLLLLHTATSARLATQLVTSTPWQADMNVLLEFKSGIQDPENDLASWRRSPSAWKSGPCATRPPWKGVSCHPVSKRVIALQLEYMPLSGSMPPAISGLGALTSLSVQHTNLSGHLPSQLSSLASLHILTLFDNKFTGGIPKELSVMTTLQQLSLASNALVGSIPSQLSALVNLDTLDLSANNLSGVIPSLVLSHLTKLQYLQLAYNQLHGNISSFVFSSSVLLTVELASNSLHGTIPPNMCSLSPHLQALTLDHNRITGSIPTGLGECRDLQYLTLGSNQLTGALPSAFCAHQPSLYSFVASNNRLTGSLPSSIARCTNLLGLELADNCLGGALPPALSGLAWLTELQLSNNNLSGSLPSELGQLPALVDLRLDFNHFSGSIPTTLGNISTLQFLHLTGNHLNGTIPESLAKCEALQELDLAYNRHTGSIPSALGGLQGLQLLRLDYNALSSTVPSELGNLSALLELHLAGNRLSGQLPALLGRLGKTLRALSGRGNQLRAPLPAQLSDLSRVSFLDLKGNSLGGSFPASIISSMVMLVRLDLSDNALSGSLPSDALSLLSSLQSLDLGINSLSGSLPDSLSALTALSAVLLQSNRLTGGIPTGLTTLALLRSLNLSHNALEGSLPLSLPPSLAHLDVAFNNISGPIPPSYARFAPSSFSDNPLLCGAPLALSCPPAPLPSPPPPSFDGVPPKYPSPAPESSGLSAGAIVGIVVGLVTAAAVTGVLLLLWWRRRSSKVVESEPGWKRGERDEGSRRGRASEDRGSSQKGPQNNSSAGAGAAVGVPGLGQSSSRWANLIGSPLLGNKEQAVAGMDLFGDMLLESSPLTFEEILDITDNFSDKFKIGSGGFGSVYRLRLRNGREVAVKRLIPGRLSRQGNREFLAEVQTLGCIRHRNLVTLLGSFVSSSPAPTSVAPGSLTLRGQHSGSTSPGASITQLLRAALGAPAESAPAGQGHCASPVGALSTGQACSTPTATSGSTSGWKGSSSGSSSGNNTSIGSSSGCARVEEEEQEQGGKADGTAQAQGMHSSSSGSSKRAVRLSSSGSSSSSSSNHLSSGSSSEQLKWKGEGREGEQRAGQLARESESLGCQLIEEGKGPVAKEHGVPEQKDGAEEGRGGEEGDGELLEAGVAGPGRPGTPAPYQGSLGTPTRDPGRSTKGRYPQLWVQVGGRQAVKQGPGDKHVGPGMTPLVGKGQASPGQVEPELGERLLVYEYVPCGNLQEWIHPQLLGTPGASQQSSEQSPRPGSGRKGRQVRRAVSFQRVNSSPLDEVKAARFNDWRERMQIALGAARGLRYLHEECSPVVVHRDVKPSNILLDEDMTAHVSDFGLARLMDPDKAHISTKVSGTIGVYSPLGAHSTPRGGLLNC